MSRRRGKIFRARERRDENGCMECELARAGLWAEQGELFIAGVLCSEDLVSS